MSKAPRGRPRNSYEAVSSVRWETVHELINVEALQTQINLLLADADYDAIIARLAESPAFADVSDSDRVDAGADADPLTAVIAALPGQLRVVSGETTQPAAPQRFLVLENPSLDVVVSGPARKRARIEAESAEGTLRARGGCGAPRDTEGEESGYDGSDGGDGDDQQTTSDSDEKRAFSHRRRKKRKSKGLKEGGASEPSAARATPTAGAKRGRPKSLTPQPMAASLPLPWLASNQRVLLRRSTWVRDIMFILGHTMPPLSGKKEMVSRRIKETVSPSL